MSPLMMQSSNKVQPKSAVGLRYGVNLKRLMNGTFVWEGSQGSCYPVAARHQGFPGFQGRNRWTTRQSEKQRSAPGNNSDSVVR